MLRGSGLDRKFQDLEVIRCYRESVGEVIWKKTREAFVRERTLVLKMDSGPVKQELSFRKSQLISLINEMLNKQVIDQVDIW